jgi:hypothetical protein
MANDTATWPFLGAGENPLPSRAKQPMEYQVPNTSGYPNNVARTDTLKTRGTGAATKGLNSSKRMG